MIHYNMLIRLADLRSNHISSVTTMLAVKNITEHNKVLISARNFTNIRTVQIHYDLIFFNIKNGLNLV